MVYLHPSVAYSIKIMSFRNFSASCFLGDFVNIVEVTKFIQMPCQLYYPVFTTRVSRLWPENLSNHSQTKLL